MRFREKLHLLTQYISSWIRGDEWGIESRVIASSADNTKFNFGGVARNGKIILYFTNLKRFLIKI